MARITCSTMICDSIKKDAVYNKLRMDFYYYCCVKCNSEYKEVFYYIRSCRLNRNKTDVVRKLYDSMLCLYDNYVEEHNAERMNDVFTDVVHLNKSIRSVFAYMVLANLHFFARNVIYDEGMLKIAFDMEPLLYDLVYADLVKWFDRCYESMYMERRMKEMCREGESEISLNEFELEF